MTAENLADLVLVCLYARSIFFLIVARYADDTGAQPRARHSWAAALRSHTVPQAASERLPQLWPPHAATPVGRVATTGRLAICVV